MIPAAAFFQADVFVHAKSLACSPPYQGEAVTFDLIESTSARHEFEVANVRRGASSRVTGDIIEWYVEPGSWKTQGTIVPDEGANTLPFSARDFRVPSKFGNPKPRPWHAATFTIAQTLIGARAGDIDLDTRYPLQRFAYLGIEDEMIRFLNEMALPEEWNYRYSGSSKDAPILYSYLHFTFAKLRDEDRASWLTSRGSAADLPLLQY